MQLCFSPPNNSSLGIHTVVCFPVSPDKSKGIDLFKWQGSWPEYLIWAQSCKASHKATAY